MTTDQKDGGIVALSNLIWSCIEVDTSSSSKANMARVLSRFNCNPHKGSGEYALPSWCAKRPDVNCCLRPEQCNYRCQTDFNMPLEWMSSVSSACVGIN